MISFEATVDITYAQAVIVMISQKVQNNLRLAVRYSALEVYNGARDLCPVVTGNLRDSIDVVYLFEPPSIGALISTNVEYAQDVEFNENYDHSVGPRKREVNGVVQNLQQSNDKATFGMFRKTLAVVEPKFRERVAQVLSMGE